MKVYPNGKVKLKIEIEIQPESLRRFDDKLGVSFVRGNRADFLRKAVDAYLKGEFDV